MGDKGTGHYYKLFLAVFLGVLFAIGVTVFVKWFYLDGGNYRSAKTLGQKTQPVIKKVTGLEQFEKNMLEQNERTMERLRLQGIESRKKTDLTKKLKQRCVEWKHAATENSSSYANEQQTKYCNALYDYVQEGAFPKFSVK